MTTSGIATRLTTLLAAPLVLAAGLTLAQPGHAHAAVTQSETFTTPGHHLVYVPVDVPWVEIHANGASGGSIGVEDGRPVTQGGAGASLDVVLSNPALAIVDIYVGAAGGDLPMLYAYGTPAGSGGIGGGGNGGTCVTPAGGTCESGAGGGGASSVYVDSTPLLVAAGGGGASLRGNGGFGGRTGGTPGTGETGSNAQGGLVTGGGAAGTDVTGNSSGAGNGFAATGGWGGQQPGIGGGGGGGGYFGGGGGAQGGGGGGSSYLASSAPAFRTSWAEAPRGNGSVTVAWGTADRPAINSAPAPSAATIGRPYGYQFTTAGFPPAAFSLDPSQGALPPGLTLTSDGLLTGVPTALGTYGFTVVALVPQTGYDSQRETITISPPPSAAQFVPEDEPLNATVGEPVSHTFATTGFPEPTVSLAPGNGLPPGLGLTADGALSGTPTTEGSYSFVLFADNRIGPTAQMTATVIVAAKPTTSPTFHDAAPPNGQVGSSYSYRFVAEGDPTPTVSLARGNLPTGLILAADGTVSGIPTEQGSFSFVLHADNGPGSIPASFATSIVINPLPVVTPPHVSVGNVSLTEGNRGMKRAILTVTLDRATDLPVTVHWTTVGRTAHAPSDFLAAKGVLTIPASNTTATVAVWVRGERQKERNESLALRLSQPTNAAIAQALGIVTIVNDD